MLSKDEPEEETPAAAGDLQPQNPGKKQKQN